jgi:hypothetical protein
MSDTNEPITTATPADDLDHIKEDLDLLLRYRAYIATKSDGAYNFSLVKW